MTYCYAFLGKYEARVSDVVITCTIPVCERMTNVLLDPGSTCSYVSVSFVFMFGMIYNVLYAPIHVSTLVGESIIVTYVYRACPI